MEELLCPFCKVSVHVNKYYPYDGYQGEPPTYEIKCPLCNIMMQNNDKEKLKNNWKNFMFVVSKIEG